MTHRSENKWNQRIPCSVLVGSIGPGVTVVKYGHWETPVQTHIF